mgnify:CR=1 FL=1
MEIQAYIPRDGLVQLKLKGDLDLYNAPELRRTLSEYIEDGQAIILDCEEMGYIDSSGIGVLVSTYTQMRAKKLPMWMVNVGGSVRKVLKLTSLLGFFPIAESLEEAISMSASNTSGSGPA